jgi:DNA-binding XRE family transcriptional regulator
LCGGEILLHVKNMDAENYKAARKQLGLNQEQLAEKLGVTRKTITSRETGAPIGKEAQMAIKSLLVNAQGQASADDNT